MEMRSPAREAAPDFAHKGDYYADVSLDQWLALTPPELVSAHLNGGSEIIRALRTKKSRWPRHSVASRRC
jgi:oxalate decarboxylase/phosphoglucose isomerase-like protein (cupin superfamily)